MSVGPVLIDDYSITRIGPATSLYKKRDRRLDVCVILSGSHEPGIDIAAWHLPVGTAARFERPAPELRRLIANYAVLDSDISIFKGPSSWILPMSPMLWFALTPDILVKMRSRRPQELGQAMLIGPSSVAMPVTSRGGVSIVIEPTARGWSRLFNVSAASMRDRIVPLDEYISPALVAEFLRQLHASDRGTQVKGILDGLLSTHLPSPNDQEAKVERIARLIIDDAALGNVTGWPVKAGIGSARTLARLCNDNFGFAPKVLQRRHRFLAVFTKMLMALEKTDFGVAPPGYHDVPHFHRDACGLLSMTARRFLEMPSSYLRATLRARRAVVGTPLSLLDQIDIPQIGESEATGSCPLSPSGFSTI